MEATREIEVRILAVLRIKENYYKYRNIIQTSFFSSEETRQVHQVVEQYYERYDTSKITIRAMKLIILRTIKEEELRKNCISIIRKLRKQDPTDNTVMSETIRDFAKRQIVKLAITDSLQLLDTQAPDFSVIRDHLDKAINISDKEDETLYKYFEDPENRIIAETNEKKIPTLIPKIDEALRGGISPGELCVFLGPPGRGKTLALINMGVGALAQGLQVCHVTLEISARKVARRYDLRISGSSFERLQSNPSRIKNPLARLRKRGCDLIIKDYNMEHCKVSDIQAMMINYQNKTRTRFDLLIVDYGDLLSPARASKEPRFALEEIYTDLRRLGNKLAIPVYTASQSTRKSLSKMVVTMEDVAEAFGKVKVADIVIGISQSMEEEEENICRFFIAKSRKSSGHPIIRLEMDPEKMYLGEMGGWNESQTDRSRGKQKDFHSIRD